MIMPLKRDKSKRIKSLQHLENKIEEGYNKYVISLGKGKILEFKWIYYDGITKRFNIFEFHKKGESLLTHHEMFDIKKTNIGRAIQLESLYISGSKD